MSFSECAAYRLPLAGSVILMMFPVILGEKFEDNYFLVPKDRALTESTNDELKTKYASLTPEAVEGLKRYPAIFADENHSYGKIRMMLQCFRTCGRR